MKNLLIGFLFAFSSVAFAQNATFIDKIEDGDVHIKAKSFINSIILLDNQEYAGLTFVFTPKDKSEPEENYYKIPTSSCRDKTGPIFETNKNGKLRDFQVANLLEPSHIADKLAVAICQNYTEYQKSPESFNQNTAFIENVVNNSFRKQWNTLFENPTTDISSLKDYFKVEKDIIYAIIRLQDLADKKVTSSEIAKINFPLSKCSAKTFEMNIEKLDGTRKSTMSIDMKDESSSKMISRMCELAKEI